MKRILVVEDEPQMRKNMELVLRREGFAVIVAPDGAEGIALARRELPDLILCDVMMPEVDGYGVLGALRGERATETIPFIFLTAKGDTSEIRSGMNLGADDYLTKPVSVDDLLGAIRARLARSAQHRRDLRPVFESPVPLERLGLTPREAEVLFWVAQGKTNAEIATIVDAAAPTVKKHLEHVFEKLSVENRASATLCALEVLSEAAPEASRS
jgi:DNA-binding NarL/FixJ family response regulator